MEETSSCRQHIELVYQQHPELFPPGFEMGFIFKGTYHSKKQDIDLRRIRLKASDETYQIRPSLLMCYMVARTDEVEKALYLLHWGVSCDGLAYAFGRSPSFWYRIKKSMGRPSIVGTTIKSKDKLPASLVADEKHTRINGQKVFIPTTVANGCILGASVVQSASVDDLEAGYGEFADEAQELDPEYSPETVCTDGWQNTWSAWWKLFPAMTVLLCFLHSAIKIRDCRTSEKALQLQTLTKVWDAFRAETKASFSQRIRRLSEWVKANLLQGKLREAVLKLCEKRVYFAMAYDFIKPYRTSNAVDRLMDHQDRLLYTMRYFHGNLESATAAVRAMALMWNFHPYGARLRRKETQRVSPFADLNGFVYHKNWLQNFLIASSLGGHRPSS
jgi:hypothetical protein